jgi:hypothetical protein
MQGIRKVAAATPMQASEARLLIKEPEGDARRIKRDAAATQISR